MSNILKEYDLLKKNYTVLAKDPNSPQAMKVSFFLGNFENAKQCNEAFKSNPENRTPEQQGFVNMAYQARSNAKRIQKYMDKYTDQQKETKETKEAPTRFSLFR